MPTAGEKPPINDFVGQLGARLREAREDRDLTLQELEEVTGIGFSTIGAIERGQKNTSIAVVARLVGGLRVDWSKLMTGLPEPPPPTARGRRGPVRRPRPS